GRLVNPNTHGHPPPLLTSTPATEPGGRTLKKSLSYLVSAALIAVAGLAVNVTAQASAQPTQHVTAQATSTKVAATQRKRKAPRSRYFGRDMAAYNGPMEQAWVGYHNAAGKNKKWLKPLVDAPKVMWMG